MARYFAELKNNIVERVIVADSEQWCVDNLGGEWVETFIDNLEKNYAGIGYIHNKEKSNFNIEKPFASYILNEKLRWDAPRKYPKDGKPYAWDESTLSWVTDKQ